ncbi:MAG: hypothetical protein ICV73_29675 [Acetobacteraceae bacterium]|nr:hypothetical protein [Acetobacteraceae bacterium]
MPGLSLEARTALCAALERRVLDRPRAEDGAPALLLTPCDVAVFKTLALDFYCGASGRCDPGLRALRRKAGVALGTASNATRRLRRAGWLTWRLAPRYVHGALRLCRAYALPDAPPGLRSSPAPEPDELEKRLRKGPVDKPVAAARPAVVVGGRRRADHVRGEVLLRLWALAGVAPIARPPPRPGGACAPAP